MRHALRFCAVAVISAGACAHDKPSGTGFRPEIVFEAKGPFPATGRSAFLGFGRTCDSGKERLGFEQKLDPPKSLYELMGAAVRTLRVREYSDRWKTTGDVERRLRSVLTNKTDVAFGSVPWAEGVNLDLVVTVEFVDRSEGRLEVSGWHACFVDHNNEAWWVTILTNK